MVEFYYHRGAAPRAASPDTRKLPATMDQYIPSPRYSDPKNYLAIGLGEVDPLDWMCLRRLVVHKKNPQGSRLLLPVQH